MCRALPPQLRAHMHEMLRGLEREARDAGRTPYEGELLHTRIHSEGFIDQSQWDVKLTTSTTEQAAAERERQMCRQPAMLGARWVAH